MAHADKKARLCTRPRRAIYLTAITRRVDSFVVGWTATYLGESHYRDNVAYLRQSLKRYGVGMALEVKVMPLHS